MKREIKFRAWNGSFMIYESLQKEYDDYYMLNLQGEFFAHTRTGDEYFRMYDSQLNHLTYKITQYTGLKDNRNNREVYECDVYFEEDAQDYGDRRIFFVITWINERCAFAMLEVSEYHSYIKNGFDAIERDFDGFYFEVMQSSIDKMHYAGNIYQNPDLL